VLLVRQNGGTIFDAFAAIFVAALLYRWVRRLQFRRWLAHTRITPDQLDALMKSNEPPLILDARPPSVREKESHRIAGARPLDLDSPDPIHPEFLKRPIVVYCVCPNEATAKRIVARLHRKNIHHIRALKGGLDAWEKRGYPVEPLPPDFNTAMAHMIEDHDHSGAEGEYTVRARLAE
jgi:rhodanese-related sulfurtransferase